MIKGLPEYIGYIWYRDAAEFVLCRSRYLDRESYFPTFEERLEASEKKAAELRANGHVVIKAYPYPDYFVWCRAEAMAIDAGSREKFASLIAFKHIQGKGILKC